MNYTNNNHICYLATMQQDMTKLIQHDVDVKFFK